MPSKTAVDTPVLAVRYQPDEAHPDDRQAAARDAIAIATGQPLVAWTGRAVQPTSRSEDVPRLSYVLAGDRFAYDGRLGTGSTVGVKRLNAMQFLQARKPVLTRSALASPRHELQRWWRVKHSITPGTGGRPRRPEVFTTDDALQAVVNEYGLPVTRESANGGRMFAWELDALGDGIVLARLSGTELQKGETVFGQVETCLRTSRTEKRRARWLVISINTSGTLPFERRLDFAFVDEKIESGTCRWVVVRGPDRIAREPLPLQLFFRMLRDSRVELLVSQMGGLVDWDRDAMQLDTLALIARQESRFIRQRTHDAIHRRFLEQGRGWPGSVRFGCQRNPLTKDVEESPEQMEVVRWLVQRFLEDSRKGTASLRSLRAALLERWQCRLSHERIKSILVDPLYVTGEWFVVVDGHAVECKPVRFERPVSSRDHMLVRQYLAVRGSNNDVTPLGHFLGNYVPFLHARCADEHVERVERRRPSGQAAEDIALGFAEPPADLAAWSTPMLRGYRHSHKTRERYRHVPSSPECCRRWPGVDRELVDRAIVRGLRELAASPELEEAYERTAQQALMQQGGTGVQATDVMQRRRELLDRLERQRAAVAAASEQYLAQSLEDALPPDAKRTLLEEPRHELQRLETALEVLERRSRKVAQERSREVPAHRPGLVGLLHEVLTEDVPADPDARVARASLVRAMLSYIELRDTEDGYEVVLHGPLIPATGREAPVKPLESPEVQRLLELHRRGGVRAMAQSASLGGA